MEITFTDYKDGVEIQETINFEAKESLFISYDGGRFSISYGDKDLISCTASHDFEIQITKD